MKYLHLKQLMNRQLFELMLRNAISSEKLKSVNDKMKNLGEKHKNLHCFEKENKFKNYFFWHKISIIHQEFFI